MKVKELIQRLSEYPEDFDVVLAKDEEGNGFSPASDVAHAIYYPETTYSGWIEDVVDTQEDPEGPEEYEMVSIEDSNSVVIWPIN